MNLTQKKLAIELLDVLGIEARGATKLTLEISANEPMRAVVSHIIKDGEAIKLIETVRLYEITEKQKEPAK